MELTLKNTNRKTSLITEEGHNHCSYGFSSPTPGIATLMMIIFVLVDYDEFSEARYFADQSGVFEIAVPSDENGNKVMQQVS